MGHAISAADGDDVCAVDVAEKRRLWEWVNRDDEGVLNPHWPATFVVWDTPGGRTGTLPTLVGGPGESYPQVPVARRTVTKYRKMLNIPSSRQRKDWTLTQA